MAESVTERSEYWRLSSFDTNESFVRNKERVLGNFLADKEVTRSDRLMQRISGTEHKGVLKT